MGVVWAAVNEKTERAVALKLIAAPTEELRQLLVKEARAVGRVKHRNIVELYDIEEMASGEPFLVMELLTGEALDQKLQRERRLPPQTAVQIALGVARALGAAHGAGIVHRDLKPANIFLHRDADAEDAVVKVFDFGISKTITPGAASSHHGGIVGSPLYMSPEQARAGSSVDHRTDIWALGVTLFEMVSGVKPVQGTTVYEVIEQLITKDVPPVTRLARSVDPRLSDVIARCLARDREARIQSAAELVKLLRPFAPSSERVVDDDEATSFFVPSGIAAARASRPAAPEPAAGDEEETAFYQRPQGNPFAKGKPPKAADADLDAVTFTDADEDAEATARPGAGARAGAGTGTVMGAGAGAGATPPTLTTSTAVLIPAPSAERQTVSAPALDSRPFGEDSTSSEMAQVSQRGSRRKVVWILAAAAGVLGLLAVVAISMSPDDPATAASSQSTPGPHPSAPAEAAATAVATTAATQASASITPPSEPAATAAATTRISTPKPATSTPANTRSAPASTAAGSTSKAKSGKVDGKGLIRETPF